MLLGLCHGTSTIRSDDAFLHLAAGREIVNLGTLPGDDTLLDSEEPGPWIMHSWLAELLFYGAMQVGGIHLLLCLRALLVGLTLVLLFTLLRGQGAPPWLAALLAAAVLLAPGIRAVLMRPLLFTHLFFVLYLLVILQVRRGRWPAWRLWVLPLVMLPWANLHAGHVAGVALAVLALVALLVEDRAGWRSPDAPRAATVVLPLVATLGATLVNPYGPKIWLYALRFGGEGRYAGQVWEWVAASPSREPALFALLGVGLLVAVAASRRMLLLPVVVAVTLMATPLLAARFLFHGAVGAALALGMGLPLLGAGRALAWTRRLPVATGPTLAGLVLVTALAHGVATEEGFRFSVDHRFFPIQAVRFMQQNRLEGRMLNFREWGGYLLWHRPGRKVFVDGRVAASAGKQLADYLAVAEARPGFGNVLNRRQVQLILSPHHMLRPGPGAPLQPIAHDRNWALTYFDDVALIYQRVTPNSREELRRLAFSTLVPGDDASPFRRSAPPQQVEAELRRAQATMPSARVKTYLGVLLLAAGKYDEAEQALRGALVLRPDSPPVLNNLGVLAMRRKDTAGARRLFQRVLELDPGHKNARLNLDSLGVARAR